MITDKSRSGLFKIFKMILLDLILPDMNGLDILAEVKKNPKLKDILVFILSNQSDAQIPEGAAKPDKFMIKANITPTELLEVVQKELQVWFSL